MKYEWDENKNQKNLSKHKVDFNRIVDFEWDTALEHIDDRYDYGEVRRRAIGYIGVGLYHLIFTYRGDAIRIISLRKANKREVKEYAET